MFASQKIELKNINKVPYFCVPISENSEFSNSVPKFDSTKDYYSECLKLKIQNDELGAEIDLLNNSIQNMKEELINLEKNSPSTRVKKYQVSKKRDRRKSGQILRVFKCEFCDKSYGSEGSLNHHMRLKHFESFQEIHIEKALQKSENKS